MLNDCIIILHKKKIEKLQIICLLFVVSYLPGGGSSSAVSRLDQTAFSGPSGSAVSDQTFTAERFYCWLLTTFDEVCLPLIIVSNSVCCSCCC